MNVFVLCTGRNGSVTFSRACRHITNYTAGHESRAKFIGSERFAYPENHIEADNRLSWMLGRLYDAFGDEAFYVHMTRDEDKIAESFAARYNSKVSIIRAYRTSVLKGATSESELIDICHDYCNTVTTNITMFLRERPHKMDFPLEQATELFPQFWDRINAEGDIDAALAEWGIRYNQRRQQHGIKALYRQIVRPATRALRKGTTMFRQALQH